MTTEIDTPAAAPSVAWPRLLWPALAVILLAVAGSLGYLWWFSRPPAEGDPEVVFARDMIAHHNQAVEMALILRQRTSDAELAQLGLDIILTQQAQVGQMQGWLEVWRLPFSGPRPPMSDHSQHGADMPPNMGLATALEMESLTTLSASEAEIQFLRLMIRHHQGGVYMATHVLDQSPRPEVVRLAQAIVASQQTEIGYMQRLLQERGVAPGP